MWRHIPVAASVFLQKSDPCDCTGDNTGVEHAKFGPSYGTACGAWDNDHCAELWGVEKTGSWCCTEWCYVSPDCPDAKASHLGSNLHYLYADSKRSTCASQTQELELCRYETQRYPGGGVAVPNLNGKPCRAGYEKVTGPMGNKYCAPAHNEHTKGCVSAVDCEPGMECHGEGTAAGGVCVAASSGYVVHPRILDATCISSDDCREGFVCHGPGPNGKMNCVLEGDEVRGCFSVLDCPDGMSCKGVGYNHDVESGRRLPQGAICVAAPKHPVFHDTISHSEATAGPAL
mmetsp:Transcript_76771/g.205051  ORF Transcript_76771/g.205051 Transcript_76771/m.205051 type:complete len:288 (-) Transcript_76771:61-924(-)